MSDVRSLLIYEAAGSASACEVKAGLDIYTLTGETSEQLDNLAQRHSSAAQETIGGYLSQLGAAPTGEDLDDLWTRVEEDVERCCLYRFCVDKIAELKDTEYVATSLMLSDKAWTNLSEASFDSLVNQVSSGPSPVLAGSDEDHEEGRLAHWARMGRDVPGADDVPDLI